MTQRSRGFRACLYGAAAATVGVLIAGCAHLPEPPATRFEKPFVLFWTSRPEELSSLTHVTPQVDLPGEKKARPKYLKAAWLERGVVPLRWKGGWCYRDWSEDELCRHFSDAEEAGHVGIAIDEWGGGNQEFDQKMGRALLRTREAHPDLFIAVWCFGLFRMRVAEYLRDVADVVMIERYVDGATPDEFAVWFNAPIRVAREAGILHKTVFALGINDKAPPEEFKKHGAWANTPAELEAQMRWIRKNAPEMPGIAFFAPRCSDAMRDLADRLAGELWKGGE